MLQFRASLALILAAAVAASPALATTTSGAPPKSSHKHHSKKAAHKVHGQQAIQPARVTEIQQALIREHYMAGEPSAKWDSETQAAMLKFQADQGWQTKLMPDSRALKKLGLGPDYSTAINAKDSSFGPPPPATSIPASQTAGFAAAAGTAN